MERLEVKSERLDPPLFPSVANQLVQVSIGNLKDGTPIVVLISSFPAHNPDTIYATYLTVDDTAALIETLKRARDRIKTAADGSDNGRCLQL